MPKRITPLSEVQVRNAKPKDKDYKLMDGYGLFLLVTSSSGKLWRFDYRFGSKRKTLSFGVYPTITLAEARQRREDAKRQIANGIDPSDAKKHQKLQIVAKAEHDANTFEKVAREWHAHRRPEWSDNHAERLLVRLEQDVFPWIGSKPITDIKTPELVQLLQRIATRTIETAYRVKMALGMVCQYAVLQGITDSNPAASLRGVLPARRHKHMAAPTEPKVVAELMRAIDSFQGTFVVKCALQLSPMLFARPGEIRKMLWADVDLETAEWKYFVTKVKLNHLVPLSKQAIEILKSLKPLTMNSKYVFPSIRSSLVPMSDRSLRITASFPLNSYAISIG